MSGHARKFLNKKGTLEKKENHSLLMVFGSKENDPSGSFNDLWLSFNFACVN
jgi:hypothetical protein